MRGGDMAPHARTRTPWGCELAVIYAPHMPVIRQQDLPFSRIASELVGEKHDGLGVCILFVDAPPGRGPSLHKHPYEEVFIVQEGRATFELDGEKLEASAGDIVIAPPGTPHAFVNSGDGPLRQIDIHVSPRFDTEWL
jgi:mannose-6-phosphate isomerase-like protein (cupin superfamily)